MLFAKEGCRTIADELYCRAFTRLRPRRPVVLARPTHNVKLDRKRLNSGGGVKADRPSRIF